MNITPFIYQGIALQESCWIDGVPFFTRRAIGEWLEYPHPKQAIEKIIRRHPYIEDSRWCSVVPNLGTTWGTQTIQKEQRVYNPIGLQLIVFESHRPKAIQYKIAVANLVWALMNGEIKPSKWSQKDDLVSAARQILSLPQGQKRGTLVRDLAERDGVSLQTAYRRVNKATGQRLKTAKGRPICRKDRGSTRYPAEKAKVLVYIKEHPGVGGKRIKKFLGLTVSDSRITTWIRESKLRKE